MTIEQIREVIEEELKFDISTRDRRQFFIEARALYYEMCLRFTSYSLTDIGKSIGYDHSTVIHQRKQNFCRDYPDYTYRKQRILIINSLNAIALNDSPSDVVAKIDLKIEEIQGYVEGLKELRQFYETKIAS